MKFSDQKKDYFSRLEIENSRLEYSIWDDYDEYDEYDDYYDEYFPEFEVYLEPENYFRYSYEEKVHCRKIRFGYTQINISSFMSLNKIRQNKLKSIFDEQETEYRPTFYDLINIK